MSIENLTDTQLQQKKYADKLFELKSFLSFFEKKRDEILRNLAKLKLEYVIDIEAHRELSHHLQNIIQDIQTQYGAFVASDIDKSDDQPANIMLDFYLDKLSEIKEVCENHYLVDFFKTKTIMLPNNAEYTKLYDSAIEEGKQIIGDNWTKELNTKLFYHPRGSKGDEIARSLEAGTFIGGLSASIAFASVTTFLAGVTIALASVLTCGVVAAAFVGITVGVIAGCLMHSILKKQNQVYDNKMQQIENYDKQENHPLAQKKWSSVFDHLSIFKANKKDYLQKPQPLMNIPDQEYDDYFSEKTFSPA